MENGKEKANTMQVLILNIHSIHLDFSEKPEYMDEERWEKTKRIKSEADKKRSCASGYLLWIMCQKMQIIAPSYGYTKKGKPYLQGVENLSFNLSHSGDYAVLAQEQSLYKIKISRIRGTIYDCNMIPITNNSSKTIAAILPTSKGVAAIKNCADSTLLEDTLLDLIANKPSICEVDKTISSEGISFGKGR